MRAVAKSRCDERLRRGFRRHERILALQERHELVARDGLLLIEVASELVQLELVLLQDLRGTRMRLLDELTHVLVHALGGARRAGERGVLVEIRVLDGAKRHHAELLRHTEARDHVARELRGLFDVVGGTGGHLDQ